MHLGRERLDVQLWKHRLGERDDHSRCSDPDEIVHPALKRRELEALDGTELLAGENLPPSDGGLERRTVFRSAGASSQAEDGQHGRDRSNSHLPSLRAFLALMSVAASSLLLSARRNFRCAT